MLTLFTNKGNAEASAARSLASLGSAQLAPKIPKFPLRCPCLPLLYLAWPKRCSRMPSQKLPQRRKRAPREAPPEVPRGAPEEPSQRSKKRPVLRPLLVQKPMVFHWFYSKSENLCYHGTGSEESAREGVRGQLKGTSLPEPCNTRRNHKI